MSTEQTTLLGECIDVSPEQKSKETIDREASTPTNDKPNGSLTVPDPDMFYVCSTIGSQPWLDGEPVLVSAGNAWNNPSGGNSGEFSEFNNHIPDTEELFIDSGGFQVVTLKSFDGEFPYTPERYFEWAEHVGAKYVAGMDWVCSPAEAIGNREKDSKRNPEEIRSPEERRRLTYEAHERCIELYRENNYSFRFVPVVQGGTVEMYEKSIDDLYNLGLDKSYMGIGSLKGRKKNEIHKILQTCRKKLPDSGFHLFGATKRIWRDRRILGSFVSSDSHSWAAKTPEGEWTSSKEDKRRAFYGSKEDMEELREQARTANSLGSFVESRLDKEWDCAICGKIDPTADDPDIKCRECDRRVLNFKDQRHHVEDAPESAYISSIENQSQNDNIVVMKHPQKA